MPAKFYDVYSIQFNLIVGKFFGVEFFSLFFTEKLYKEPTVRVPSLQRLSKIARDLGLDMEERELKEYRGRFFKNREILSSRFKNLLFKNLGVVYYCYRGYFQDSG